ncbi:glutathione S-transferase family protein [Glaciecola sp. SC05]|uniref:glutathione S-transferase family protein n=1 Tax=Glaciecola sp. SC05 TaxID=1987355 RepID=UPI0035274134
MMTLYGSMPSPYARRLRLLMAEMDYEFVIVDVYASEDRAMLIKQNPTLKIPMLDDDGLVVFDSRMIFQYLVDKKRACPLDFAQQNLLTSIDSANDSLVNLFLLRLSKVNIEQDALYFRLQNERIEAVLKHLEEVIESNAFAKWNFLGMSLFAMLDWIKFRELYDLTAYPKLLAYHHAQTSRQECIDSDPR